MTDDSKHGTPLPHPEDAAGTLVGRLWDDAAAGPILVVLRDGHLHDVTAPRSADDARPARARRPGRLRSPRAAPAATSRPLADHAGRAARAVRPAGGQGLRRHLRPLDDRARDRGARRRRPGPRRGDPRARRRPDRRLAARHRAGLRRRRRRQGGAPDGGPVVAVPRGRHRPRRRGLHQGPAAVRGRLGRRGRPPPGLELEQPRARGRARRRQPRPHRAARRSATTSTCATSRAARALLLGKAKDNNASCAIGPFIRLFDDGFSLDDVRAAELTLTVDGRGRLPPGGPLSSMREISRDPPTSSRRRIGRHHQYPDGFMLFLGTMFAPIAGPRRPGPGLHPPRRRRGDHRRAPASARSSTPSASRPRRRPGPSAPPP